MTETPLPAHIQQVRRFHRFCDHYLREYDDRALQQICVSITDMLVLEELGRAADPRSLAWLHGRLLIDKTHLCRTLKMMDLLGWTSSWPSVEDRRERMLALTKSGQRLFQGLKRFQEEEARRLLESVPDNRQAALVEAMGVIVSLLGRDPMTRALELHRCGGKKLRRYCPT